MNKKSVWLLHFDVISESFVDELCCSYRMKYGFHEVDCDDDDDDEDRTFRPRTMVIIVYSVTFIASHIKIIQKLMNFYFCNVL